MPQSKTPHLRFKGFSGEWEEKELGNLGEFRGGGTPSKQNDNYWVGSIPWISSSDINENDINKVNISRFINEQSVKESATKIIPKNSILFVSRVGVGKLAINQQELCTSQDFTNFTPKDTSSYYLGYLFQTKKNILESFNQGTSIKGFTKSNIEVLKIIFPNKKEQTKIGDYFQRLDALIEQKEKKYQKLKQFKTAMLSQMFPKEGARTPKFRFKGFSGEWEEKKLLDNIEKIIDFRGRTPKKIGLDWSAEGYLALSALNVKNGYIDFNVEAHYGNQDLYDSWMSGNELHKNQVLFTTEAPMGNVAQIPDNKKYILSQRTIAFDVKSELITEDFLAVLLRTPLIYKKFLSLSSGGTAKGVSQRSLSNVDVFITKEITEQTKIGNYFQKLDTLINLHQKELEKLKNMKKALLAKMFV